MTITTACPTGCGRNRKGEHLMCLKCWSRVPSTLKRDVNKTWRMATSTGKPKAYEKYRVARDAAIASVVR